MFKNMKLGLRLGVGFGILVAIMLTIGAVAISRIGQIDQKVGTVVTGLMPKVTAANDWIDAVNEVARVMRNQVISNDPAFVAREDEKYGPAREKIDKSFKYLEETILSKEGKALLEDANSHRMPVRQMQDKIREWAKANDDAAAAALLFGEYRKEQGMYLEALFNLVKFQDDMAKEEGTAAAAMAVQTRTLIVGLLIASALLALLIAWLVTRSITKPISRCIVIADAVAVGNTSIEIVVESTDETGALMAAMKKMVDAIQRMTADAAMLAKAAVEGKLATRADATKHQGDFRAIVSGVNDTLDSVINPLNVTAKYVDDISKGIIPPTITDSYNGDFNIIKNNLNNVVKMMNDLLKETDIIITAAADGELDKRANAALFQGGWNQLVAGVNATITNIVNPLNVTADYVDKVSMGVIPPTITDTYKGQYNIIKGNLNKMVKMMNELLSESDTLVNAALGGALSTRANDKLFVGGWNQLIAGINKTLDAVIEPVNEAAAVLDKVAARDMTARVKGDYKGDHAKIKNSLNLAVDNLDKALSQVAEGASQVASASQQISGGSQALAQGANEQARSLEEVSSSLEEMASMTRQNADNANQARNMAGEADNHAKTGTAAMNKMSSSIAKIKDSSDQTAKIVKTIDEIAMQTNLLALNAAVEAARAGEAGRGFAVVAEEVRNLAQRSAEAAKNTADMISESVRNADEGVKIAVDVSKSFELIATSAGKVNGLIAEIAEASREQSQGIEQVNTAVTQMDKVTQQNAANSEESASASEELSSQAEELQAMVAQFQLSSAGQAARPAARLMTHHAQPQAALPPSGHGKAKAPAAKRVTKTVTPEEVTPPDDETLKEF